MFAIVKTSGKQYRVAEGDQVRIDRVDAAVGDEITLDEVLLISGDDLKIGTPAIDGARVRARVVDHHKGDKVIAFKYRPRKRYRRRVGFRHSHTTLEILAIEA